MRKIFNAMLVLASIYAGQAQGDDTDLFLINSALAGSRPNVLIIMDNTANWNNAFSYEKANLKSVIDNLNSNINVGLMMFTETGSGNSNPDGAYVRYAIRQMTTTNKNALSTVVNGLDVINDKSNNQKASLAMDEAYQYYIGGTPYAGNNKTKTDYANNSYISSPVNATLNALSTKSSTTYFSPMVDNCQQNYIIYISNGKGNENTSDLTSATNALATAGGNTTAITLSDNSFQTNEADEWSRFLANNDIRPTQTGQTPDWSGTQKIKTYVIYVRDPSDASGQHPAGWKVLLQSVATNGGGKFYYVSDGSTLKSALDDAFTDMQAVNSVFSSSTLPVSVNVRGTYLNQVYMGVFRPDGNASPRWPGNLKQYKLGLDVNNNVYLADKNGLPIEQSGFISPTVTSIWTTSTDSNSPQTWPTGFWDANYYSQAQTSGGTYDAPDGNLVEKGGVAQKLRNSYPNDQSGRKLFTCTGTCTSGTSLSTSNTNTVFSTSNTNITDSSVGIFTSFAASSISRAGNVATVTATNHGLSTGDAVTVTGASPSDYNLVNQSITKIDNNTFTYQVTTSPAYPATGTITGSLAGNSSYPISSISRTNSGGATETVTVNMGGSYVSNSFTGGSLVISGTTPTQYSGTFSITCTVADCSQFTYPITLGPSTPGGGGTATGPVTTCKKVSGTTTCTTTNTAVTIASVGAKPTDGIVRSGTTITVTTTSNHGFDTNGTVTISGATPSDYNGTWTYSGASGKALTISNFSLTPSTTVTTTGSASQSGTSTISISSLTRTSTAITETATATTSSNLANAPYNLTVGNTFSITIAGANETEYNGTKTATLTAATASGSTFTYSVVTTPISPATGTITISPGSITKDSLINWVRGQNAKGEDNPSLVTTDVRGYLHGDVLHSRPAVVNYNRTSVTSAAGSGTNEDIVVYYGANDGMLHAAKGGQLDTDGYEKWGFIPSEFFSKFKRLYYESPKVTTTARDYFADGPLNVYFNDVNSDGQLISSDNDKVYLYLGMRRGGRFIYGLNVSDPDNPVYMWKKSFTDNGFAELGQSWSDMTPSYIKYFNGKGLSSGVCAALGSPSYDANCSAKSERTATAKRTVLVPALVFGAGYDTTANDATPQGTATMGRGIYVVDGRDGSIIWMAGPSKPANFPASAVFLQVTGMTYSIPADLTVIDSDNDGFADRVYAGDTGGNVWRVNIDDSDPNNWTVSQLASLAGTGTANARKFLFAPSVVYSTTYDAVLIGAGDREHPLDTTVTNRFYMIKDSHSLNATYSPVTGGSTTITESNLCDLTSDALQGTDATAKAAAQACLATSSNKGWYITLSTTGEKTVSGSSVLAGIVFFSTNVPASVVANQQCSSLGEARIYAVNYADATSAIDFTNNSTLDVNDRYVVRDGGGFVPSPTSAAVSLQATDGTTTTREFTCLGTKCITPPSAPYLTRYRTYWYKEIDQ